MSDETHFDFVIIGGGLVGLSIGKELSNYTKSLVILEKEPYICSETSSRNSEVIHSGIYYPIDSLKSELCIEGKYLLYNQIKYNNIRYDKIGKLIIATERYDEEYLHQLYKKARLLKIPITLLSKNKLLKMEPEIKANMALFSPSTGIFDSHNFGQFLVNSLEENDIPIMKNNEVIKIDLNNGKLKIRVKDLSNKNEYDIYTHMAINCAGLYAHNIANLFGANFDDFVPFKLEYWRGNYFKYHGNIHVNRLIYPTPNKSLDSLGIHLTLDLGGNIRFGPDLEKICLIDYRDNTHNLKDKFIASINYVNIDSDLLNWDYSGIRPKLKTKCTEFRDFYIKKESDNFINLLGIESPGLTSCLAIAKKVVKFIK